MMTRSFAQISLCVMIAACSDAGSGDAANESFAPRVDKAVYAAAVGHPARTSADRARDSARKPDQVLEFFGIAPGMIVLDLFSGSGYYAEILAHTVGDDGRVVAHTNEAYLRFVGDEFAARHADNRLPNVEILMAENNELELDAGRFDAIMMTLSYHDLYYAAPQEGWPKIDTVKLLAELYRGLKPGGTLAVIDHFAEVGAPRETGGTLHRIDPSIVVSELEAAGFVLDAKSDVLRNMNDDHGKPVFDPAVRGRTDRFVMRFRKPR